MGGMSPVDKLNCPTNESPDQCNPGLLASDIESLKKARDIQWSRIEEIRESHEDNARRLERLESLLRSAGGNGHPSWSERMILLEDWQRRQEKLLAALPAQLAEVNIQLQMLLSQRAANTSARTGALWTAVASLGVAILVGMGSAALMWWSSRP